MKKNILLIINPEAGNIDVDETISKVRLYVEYYRFRLEVFETTGSNDSKKINNKLEQGSFNRIVAAGGDGTINLVASLLFGKDIALGILACGSANGLATALKLPKKLSEQVLVALGENSVNMDCIMVNGQPCLHIADLGLNAELIYNYDKTSSSGKFGYLRHVLPTLFKSKYPYKVTIEIEGKQIKHTGILFALANATKFGSGAVINPDGVVDDGRFEVVVFKKLSFLTILKTFIRGATFKTSIVKTYCVTSVQITSEQYQIALQIDGEFIAEVQAVKAVIRSHVLNVLIP